jgi:hypothetical protein
LGLEAEAGASSLIPWRLEEAVGGRLESVAGGWKLEPV